MCMPMCGGYIRVLAVLIGIGMTGCASTPVATDLQTINAKPSEFRNTRVRITAPVLSNSPPQGDRYRTWIFIIGASDSYRIMATEEGFNPSTIEKAYRLVEDAREAGDEVTVTGKLRVGPYHEMESGMEIELDSVRYGDDAVGRGHKPDREVDFLFPGVCEFRQPLFDIGPEENIVVLPVHLDGMEIEERPTLFDQFRNGTSL